MSYTPQLSFDDSCILRRLAWAMKLPMTKALHEILLDATQRIDHRTVCDACRRTMQDNCPFGPCAVAIAKPKRSQS